MGKLTIPEFFNSNDEMAIYCSSKEQAEQLCNSFDECGFQWSGGSTYKGMSYYGTHYQICYTNTNHHGELRDLKIGGFKILRFNDTILGS